MEKPGAEQARPPAHVRTVGFPAAVFIFGLALLAHAQNPTPGDTSFVRLPPTSTTIGTPAGMPDGSIATVSAKLPPLLARPARRSPRAEPYLVSSATTNTAPTATVTEPIQHAVPRVAVLSGESNSGSGTAGATIVSQIHNAPGWQHSHPYTYVTGPATRVVNGVGWNETNGRFVPGQALDAYQLTSTGTCTSGAGGGPTGTGSSIEDGSCTWKHLSAVDYISLTGWAFDNQPWKPGAVYHYRDYVTSDSPLRAYTLDNEGCTSSIAPIGTGNAKNPVITTSDGCQWRYFADVIYTSRRSFIPTQIYTTKNDASLTMAANYEAQLWKDREYVAGQNGEASPIRVQAHDDATDDVSNSEGGNRFGCMGCYHLIITTAPGESFHDNLTPSDPLAGYDPTKGVAIRDSATGTYPTEPAGFLVRDNYVDLTGLQIKSEIGAAVDGLQVHGNYVIIRDCILEGGSDAQFTPTAAVALDAGPSVLANSLVISHGPVGIVSKYPMVVVHSTIINTRPSQYSVGIETGTKWIFDDTTVTSTAIFGFQHAAAHLAAGTSLATRSSHNITDTPANDSGSARWEGGSAPTTVNVLPNTTYGAMMGSAFVAPGRDWRLAKGSPLIGKGSAAGSFTIKCVANQNCTKASAIYDFDSPDIIGTARPQAGSYDIGAWQSCASPVSGDRSRCAPATR